jgi:RNA polymerase sigma-70 factor (ECF subfamily)
MTEQSREYAENVAVATKIFEEHGSYIYRVIRFQVTDESLVDDLFQNLFLKLIDNPLSLEGDELKKYLYRVIVNDVREAYRRKKRYKKLLDKYADNQEYLINKKRPKNIYSVEERVDNIIRRAWESLSPKETNAISLRYLDGYSIQEVAYRMRVKKRTVSRYLCSGLDKIRRCLSLKDGDKA